MRQPFQENTEMNPSHKIPPATAAKVAKTKVILTFNKEHQ